MNSFNPTRDTELTLHPTVKPIELIVDAIKDVCVGAISFSTALVAVDLPS